MKKITRIFIAFFVAIFILSIFFFKQTDVSIEQPEPERNDITVTNEENLTTEFEFENIDEQYDFQESVSADDFVGDFRPEMASVNFSIEPEVSGELSKISGFKVNPMTEILSKRDRTSKHYLREDGKTIDAILSPASVHYKNDQGEWDDISTSLVKIDNSEYLYKNSTNNLKSWFPENPSKDGILITTDIAEIVTGKNLKMHWETRGC